MLLVSINGLIQCPSVDYHATSNSISFSTPPQAGTTISIQSRTGTLANILGDGSTFLFQFMSDFDHDQIGMLEEAFKLRDVPAVADMLQRLDVVVKLAKQDDRSRA
jgi:hypothetical protein